MDHKGKDDLKWPCGQAGRNTGFPSRRGIRGHKAGVQRREAANEREDRTAGTVLGHAP